MRASHDLGRVPASFTEPNLISNAGLLPAAALAQRIGLAVLIDKRLRLARHGASSGAKALTVIRSILAGGDSIDDTCLLRHGRGAVRRNPGTLDGRVVAAGTQVVNVRQLDAIGRELMARCGTPEPGPPTWMRR